MKLYLYRMVLRFALTWVIYMMYVPTNLWILNILAFYLLAGGWRCDRVRNYQA